jgi:predicted NUDIX family phosphoesterase
MEFVFVIPRAELFPDCYPHGLALFGEEFSEAAFHSAVEDRGYFVERKHAEQTPSIKQVIPYSIVVRGAEVFLLRRTSKGGEVRLHNKLSIGVGGHINPVDLPTDQGGRPAQSRNPIPAATQREVADEELRLSSPYEVHTVGILNDDSNPVGAVHVGLVQVLTVEGAVEVRETDQLEGQFATIDELKAQLADGANFETWSSLLIPHLDSLIPATVAS